jgi:hypothetical protein
MRCSHEGCVVRSVYSHLPFPFHAISASQYLLSISVSPICVSYLYLLSISPIYSYHIYRGVNEKHEHKAGWDHAHVRKSYDRHRAHLSTGDKSKSHNEHKQKKKVVYIGLLWCVL